MSSTPTTRATGESRRPPVSDIEIPEPVVVIDEDTVIADGAGSGEYQEGPQEVEDGD